MIDTTTMTDTQFMDLLAEFNHLNDAAHFRTLSDTERARRDAIEAALETL